jgi:2'-phosphotransferase
MENQQDDKKKQIQISKTMSWILRHGIIKLGLKIDELGRIPLETLLKQKQIIELGADEQIIKQIVQNNDKQRFRLDLVNGIYMIGANQGHGKEIGSQISDNKLMELITVPVELCVHGTYKKVINEIKKTGLKCMERTHIHMATGFPNDLTVISGARNSANVFVVIDMKMAMDDGIVFYRSANNVILSKGINGVIEPKYFSNIIYR